MTGGPKSKIFEDKGLYVKKSEKNRHYVHFKEHILFHLPKSFYLDLGPPIIALVQYSSPIFMFNITLNQRKINMTPF